MLFYIVICFVAVAFADKLGYNYQPVHHSDTGLSFNPGSISLADGNHGTNEADSQSRFGGGGSNGVSYDGPLYSTPVELTKEFYTFSAPEDEFYESNAAKMISNSLKRGLRVIFIKGPENNEFENAAIALAKQSAEQKTAIYVLQKQTDIGDLTNKLDIINKSTNHKPEVHFVKYRTHEDAINAQKVIQNQYDSAGGISKSYDGGVAPLINFASQTSVPNSVPDTPGNAYLPS